MVMTDRFPLARHSPSFLSRFFLSSCTFLPPCARIDIEPSLHREAVAAPVHSRAISPVFLSYSPDETYLWYFDPMRNAIHGCGSFLCRNASILSNAPVSDTPAMSILGHFNCDCKSSILKSDRECRGSEAANKEVALAKLWNATCILYTEKN